MLVDSGGLEYGKKENIEADVQSQVLLAIEEADLIMFIFDAKEGLTVEDYEVAGRLRKGHKTVILAANKTDIRHAGKHRRILQARVWSAGRNFRLSQQKY